MAHFMKENIQVVTRLEANPGRVGFCTDDVTATSLLGGGHLDRLVRMAIKEGVAPMNAIQMATINTAQMYRLDHLIGSISPGRAADVLVIDDPASFVVEKVVSKGVLVAEEQRAIRPAAAPGRGPALLETMKRAALRPEEIEMRTDFASPVRVLAMEMDREVPFVRRRRDLVLPVVDGVVQRDLAQDALYVTVVERYGKTSNAPVAIVCGFGLRSGALATSAAPDDNNIICVGTNRADMALAINEVIRLKGGLAVVDGGRVIENLALPVGGIVADIDVATMAAAEARLDAAARALGCELRARSATSCSWRSPPFPTTPSLTWAWWECASCRYWTRSLGQPELSRQPDRRASRSGTPSSVAARLGLGSCSATGLLRASRGRGH